MSWAQIVVVSVVQGVTEFLPISSSAHLIMLPRLLGWRDQGLAFDLATNLGTLAAVVVYFRRDIGQLARAGGQSLVRRRADRETRLFWGLVVASVPALALGLAIGLWGEAHLRKLWIIAVASIVFGVALGVVDWCARTTRSLATLSWRAYAMIGLAQALALIPGSSRAGMSILGARAAGLDRRAAAYLSFFMAVPVTAAAIAFELVQLAAAPERVAWATLAVAALLAGATAMVAIHFFLRLVQRVGMLPFVVYRIALGVTLLLLM